MARARAGPAAEDTNNGRARGAGLAQRLYATVFGVFLGLCLLKFGNPPIMEKWVTPPNGWYEFLLGFPWPISWAYFGICILIAGGVALLVTNSSAAAKAGWRGTNVPAQLIVLPLLWLGWQVLAGADSLDPQLSRPTVVHFAACAACFYLGFFVLGRLENRALVWIGIAASFLSVLAVGFEQRFGGLEDTRRYFFAYIYPTLPDVPPEYLKKMTSTRIFGTLFYPNTLAGALLLILPPVLVRVWEFGGKGRMTTAARAVLTAIVGAAGAACLFWSGSKGGWLVMLFLCLLAFLQFQFPRKLKFVLVVFILLAGLGGFFWKYSAFFKKGATSVVARFDYWRAAAQTAAAHPLLGTGPGTFAIPYAKIKDPRSEMARLVHNDYLEQASDSGLAGAFFYTGFVVWGLWLTGRRSIGRSGSAAAINWSEAALWLGVLGWALQGLFEFGLYIPALAWAAFTFLGMLLAIDKPRGQV